MKQKIKKVLKKIIDSGYLDFFIGNLKLKTYNKLEQIRFNFLGLNRIPGIEYILNYYYKKELQKYKIKNYDLKKDNKARIFFVTNIFPLWEKSSSNFLKINGDIAQLYIKNGYEVTFILSLHSHISYLTNKGLKWNNMMSIDYKKIKNKIYEDLNNMYGIEKHQVNIEILNKNKGNIKLKNYIENVVSYFNDLNLSKKDIIFYSGGKCKSELLEYILYKLDIKKIYLSGSINEKIDLTKYIYVRTANENLKENYSNIINLNAYFEIFKWENRSKLSKIEEKIIKSLIKEKIDYIFISTKQKFADSIDDEFIWILNSISKKYPNSKIILIGDSKENILNKLSNKINFNEKNLIVIEFIENLFIFYKTLKENFNNIFFILPRIIGGGTGNLLVANAGIIPILFKGNDAEGSWLPGEYFVSTKEEFLYQIEKFIKNKDYKEKFFIEFNNFKKQKVNQAEKFYLGVIDD